MGFTLSITDERRYIKVVESIRKLEEDEDDQERSGRFWPFPELSAFGGILWWTVRNVQGGMPDLFN